MNKEECKELYFDIVRALAKVINEEIVDEDTMSEFHNAIYCIRQEKECKV